MRPQWWLPLEKHRITEGTTRYDESRFGDPFGKFFIRRAGSNHPMIVIATPGDWRLPWDHVSVSLKRRCPTWEEMCWVKDLLWLPEEPVIQIHPPKSKHVNNSEFCLHLWRPLEEALPLPPAWAVGALPGQTQAEADAECDAYIERRRQDGHEEQPG